ncbi:hypothetical protein BV898_19071 [Hypsibius exemplaris]|uniref:G-protein coupled receptors family 1 profile domain-containing protein n=1 Tax=Hypsibius exemplaris TaxID=2072580 RepID=A0A9X6NID8_HYPEX|nr:hypothetical protein BV898_19071 [Hypsibius exemplaris]
MSEASVNDTVTLPNVPFHNESFLNATFHWSATAIFDTVNFCTGLLGNGFLLVLLLTNRQIRTPFNIYILGLILANLLNITGMPLHILDALTGGTLTATNESICSYYMYLDWVESSVIYCQHVLIAVTRMWAVIRPISYRNRHSQQLARSLCVGVWVCVHACMLPFWALDALYYRRTITDNGFVCIMNGRAQFTYSVVAQVIFYLLPIFVQVMVFPVVYFTKNARTMTRAAVVPNETVAQGADLLQKQLGIVPSKHEGTSQTPSREVIPHPIPKGAPRVARSNSSGLAFLGILSLCALMNWAPIILCYFVFTVNPDFTMPKRVWEVFTTLSSVQTSIDPIIFLLSLGNLRDVAVGLARQVIGFFQA